MTTVIAHSGAAPFGVNSYDPDILVNLSEPELQALAEGMLSSRYQQRLDELLQRNREGTADGEMERELDRLLEYVDHMNVLKARANYTLRRLAETLESTNAAYTNDEPAHEGRGHPTRYATDPTANCGGRMGQSARVGLGLSKAALGVACWILLCAAAATVQAAPAGDAVGRFGKSPYSDAGPKPSVDVTVRWNAGPVPDAAFYAQMLTCNPPGVGATARCGFEAPVCERFVALELPEPAEGCAWRLQGPPMVCGGQCGAGQCSFSYFLPERFRLAVYLPSADRLFVSNPATRTALRSSYRLDLAADGGASLVETTALLRRSHLGGALLALLLSLLVELPLGYGFVRLTHSPRRALLGVAIGNLLTVPALWLIVTAVPANASLLTLGLAEVGAVVIEGGIIAGLTRRRMKLALAFAMSLALNLISFLLGAPALAVLALLGIAT